jgi:hypothetical protein
VRTATQSLRRELRAMRLLTGASVIIAATSLLGATAALRSASFDVLNTHRINIIDRNGFVRMALFDKEDEPGGVFGGKKVLTNKVSAAPARASPFIMTLAMNRAA